VRAGGGVCSIVNVVVLGEARLIYLGGGAQAAGCKTGGVRKAGGVRVPSMFVRVRLMVNRVEVVTGAGRGDRPDIDGRLEWSLGPFR
jgi:hypothetical protein